uniref:Uncharacterized protein n=1 Tax=Arundo donax TaxID=35708 RepID=A0A0A8ZK72_ARUDO
MASASIPSRRWAPPSR